MYAQVSHLVAVAFLVVRVETDQQLELHLPKQQYPMSWITALPNQCQQRLDVWSFQDNSISKLALYKAKLHFFVIWFH